MYGQYLCATAKWVKFSKAANEASVVGVAVSEFAGAELAVDLSLRALSRSIQEVQVKFETTTTCVSLVSISVGILKALSRGLAAGSTAGPDINAKRRRCGERMKGRYIKGFTTVPHAEKLTMPREHAAKIGFTYLRFTSPETASALTLESRNARSFVVIA